MIIKKILVVINPASGKPQPVLHSLNQVFNDAGVEWDISLTKKSGDAERFAREAVKSGVDVVAAYGGDGTVMEAAHGLRGSPVPLAILPGGTANLMSVELGIPKDLVKAAQIACDSQSQVQMVDMGQFGDTYFLLRVGMGFAARTVEIADRELKDKYGILAYSVAALKALGESESVDYHITLDGETIDVKGITLLVDNAGNMGISGIAPGRNINIMDGLLDVLVITDASFSSLVDIGQSLLEQRAPKNYIHYQGKQIHIKADPPQPVQVDGEMAGESPISIQVVPQALGVLVAAKE